MTFEHMLKDKEQKDIEKGRVEEQKRIAKKMLVRGADIPLIVDYTGLTEEAVLRLKEEAQGI